MSFLAEPPTWAYGLLVALIVLPALAAFLFPGRVDPRRAQKKGPSGRTLLWLLSGLALLLLIGLRTCDYFLESDQEQIIRKLHEMSDGVHERNMNKLFQ